MQPLSAEVALTRVIAYLELSGLNVTPSVERQVLAVVLEALETDESATLDTCVSLARQRFDLRSVAMPVIAPVICRGSIGYGDH